MYYELTEVCGVNFSTFSSCSQSVGLGAFSEKLGPEFRLGLNKFHQPSKFQHAQVAKSA